MEPRVHIILTGFATALILSLSSCKCGISIQTPQAMPGKHEETNPYGLMWSHYCRNDYQSIKNLRNQQNASTTNVPMELIGTKDIDGLVDSVLAKKIDPSDSEHNRLLKAYSLFLIRHPNLSEIKSLLNTPATNPVNEAYRLAYLASVKYLGGNYEASVETLKKIDYTGQTAHYFPVLYPVVLARILQKDDEESLIDSIKPNVFSHFIVAMMNIEADQIPPSDQLKMMKPVYEACPPDPDIKLYMAIALIKNLDHKSASEILSKIISESKYYSPVVDYYFGLSQLKMGNNNLAKTHLHKYVESTPYAHGDLLVSAKKFLAEIK